jgi:hypothetical protein
MGQQVFYNHKYSSNKSKAAAVTTYAKANPIGVSVKNDTCNPASSQHRDLTTKMQRSERAILASAFTTHNQALQSAWLGIPCLKNCAQTKI